MKTKIKNKQNKIKTRFILDGSQKQNEQTELIYVDSVLNGIQIKKISRPALLPLLPSP